MDVFIDRRFDADYRSHPLVLVDVGARGGLRPNWVPARQHLRLIGFEPDPREYAQLTAKSDHGGASGIFFDVALHNQRGPLQLHLARDRGLTSIFEPNRPFLDAFPESDRFTTTEVRQINADTLDALLASRQIRDIDFIKVDTQGSELLVLQGAAGALASSVVGVEVEVEFTPIYKDQPLFADVDTLLRAAGFHLFDLRPVYWKRTAGRSVGGPHGQIVWADALYLKTVPALGALVAALDPALQRGKVLRTLSICLLYGYFDYALEITRESATLTDDERRVIEAQLRRGGGPQGLPNFPGRRQLAAILRRLARISETRDDAWSISRAKLGNLP